MKLIQSKKKWLVYKLQDKAYSSPEKKNFEFVKLCKMQIFFGHIYKKSIMQNLF